MSAHPETGRNRLECRTCPYEYTISTPLFSRREFARKEKEDVFGGPGAWDNAQKTKVQCPTEGCDGDEAAFFQVQIRSADEPMTSFFKVGLPCPRVPVSIVICVRPNSVVHDVWKPVAGELEVDVAAACHGWRSEDGGFRRWPENSEPVVMIIPRAVAIDYFVRLLGLCGVIL